MNNKAVHEAHDHNVHIQHYSVQHYFIYNSNLSYMIISILIVIPFSILTESQRRVSLFVP